jgi:hypothetical protein
MAKVRRCKLSWKPSESDQVINYRLYWSKGDTVTYDSSFFELGDICEVYLPDVLKLDARYDTRVMLAVTAVDKNGNESDMAMLPKPYQTIAPPAPVDLLLTTLDQFSIVEATDEASEGFESPAIEEDTQDDELKELARIAEPLLNPRHTKDQVK